MALTAQQRQTFGEKLAQERTRIQGDLDALGAEIATLGVSQQADGSGTGNHMADEATDIAEQERDLALIGNLQDRMREVERAQARLEEGKYGICDGCGEAIPAERLDARPFATLCVNCQAQADRQRRPVMA